MPAGIIEQRPQASLTLAVHRKSFGGVTAEAQLSSKP